jgi:hypothetical protein
MTHHSPPTPLPLLHPSTIRLTTSHSLPTPLTLTGNQIDKYSNKPLNQILELFCLDIFVPDTPLTAITSATASVGGGAGAGAGGFGFGGGGAAEDWLHTDSDSELDEAGGGAGGGATSRKPHTPHTKRSNAAGGAGAAGASAPALPLPGAAAGNPPSAASAAASAAAAGGAASNTAQGAGTGAAGAGAGSAAGGSLAGAGAGAGGGAGGPNTTAADGESEDSDDSPKAADAAAGFDSLDGGGGGANTKARRSTHHKKPGAAAVAGAASTHRHRRTGTHTSTHTNKPRPKPEVLHDLASNVSGSTHRYSQRYPRQRRALSELVRAVRSAAAARHTSELLEWSACGALQVLISVLCFEGSAMASAEAVSRTPPPPLPPHRPGLDPMDAEEVLCVVFSDSCVRCLLFCLTLSYGLCAGVLLLRCTVRFDSPYQVWGFSSPLPSPFAYSGTALDPAFTPPSTLMAEALTALRALLTVAEARAAFFMLFYDHLTTHIDCVGYVCCAVLLWAV